MTLSFQWPAPSAIRIALTGLLLTVTGGCGKGREEALTWADLETELSPAGLVAEAISVSGSVRMVGGRPKLAGEVIDVGGNPFCQQHGALINPTWKIAADGGLADVVITVQGSGRASNLDSLTALIDQKNCEYLPTVTVLQAGQAVAIRNSDLTFHNVRLVLHKEGTLDKGVNLENIGQAGRGDEIVREFKRPGVYRLECDIHRWMRAWILVHEGIHTAVTSVDGSYEVKRALPDGEYVVTAWHPRFKQRLSKTIQIVNGSAELDFAFDFSKSFDSTLAIDS